MRKRRILNVRWILDKKSKAFIKRFSNKPGFIYMNPKDYITLINFYMFEHELTCTVTSEGQIYHTHMAIPVSPDYRVPRGKLAIFWQHDNKHERERGMEQYERRGSSHIIV